MESPRRRNHMAALKAHREENDELPLTTYDESFTNIPTINTTYHKYYRGLDPALKNTTRPHVVDRVKPGYREPNQMQEYHEAGHGRIMMPDYNRTRFEDATLKRDVFDEPLPDRNYMKREHDFQMSNHQHGVQGYNRDSTPGNAHHRHNSRPQVMDDKQAIFCDRCFEKGKYQNKLSCNHLYCDDCIVSIPVQDRQFRNSLCYVCELCNTMTPDPKVVRIDPDGRRVERFDDMNNFANKRGKHQVAQQL